MRKILGFAVLAIVAWLVLKIFFGLLGTLIGLAFWIVGLAVVGYVIYLVLKLIAPRTAARVREMVGGPGSASAPSDYDRAGG